jgi:hypothetical protein
MIRITGDYVEKQVMTGFDLSIFNPAAGNDADGSVLVGILDGALHNIGSGIRWKAAPGVLLE